MSTVLVIGHVWPEPTSSAAGRRMLSLLNLLAADGSRVHFACAAAPSEWSVTPSGTPGISSSSIELNSPSFDEFATALAPDIVVFDRFMTEEQFGWRVETHCPNALRLLDTVDLHCLREARGRALKSAKQPLNLFTDLAKREIASILRSDLTLLISTAELQLLQAEFRVDPELLHEFPLLADPPADTSASTPNDFASRAGFTTIGNFRHAPNYDSIVWLKEELWPLIRARLPQAQLDIWGSYVPKQAQRLDAPDDGFRIRGRADNAHDAVRAARVCLAPLRFGAGLKGKLLDALETQTPSVTTTVGVEGMIGQEAWAGIVADDAQAFADAAVRLHEDQTAWQECAARCDGIVQERFAPALHIETLTDRIAASVENLEARRQRNFMGAMLRHHQHRSTEFMSRWIEVKNRVVPQPEGPKTD